MDLKKLSEPLSISNIDFRVQSINKGGYATILAYKDARVDMNRLDEVCGQLNWKREHTRDNSNCIVSIWDESKKEWVSKEDTGTESNTEKEKGLASDSFKRACFNWGIGRELYDYPVIQVKLNQDEFEIKEGRAYATYNLKIKEWTWKSNFENGKISSLIAKDNNGVERFKYQLNLNLKNNTNNNPSFLDLEAACKKMSEAKDKVEITSIWNQYVGLQKDPKFIEATKAAGEKLPKQ
jgi:hypothetical protein